MEGLNEFMSMEETSAVKRGYHTFPKPNTTYACTVCGIVQFPTKDVNLRCRKCKAPLVESLEKIYSLQREITYYRGEKVKVQKVRERIRMVRNMKKEHAELVIVWKVQKAERERKAREERDGNIERRDIKRSKEIMIFNIMIPNKYKGNIRVPHDQMATFEKKCKRMKATYTLVATEREWEVMEDIRQSMMEGKD